MWHRSPRAGTSGTAGRCLGVGTAGEVPRVYGWGGGGVGTAGEVPGTGYGGFEHGGLGT